MAFSNKILLGRIIKSYGFDGTVTVKLEKSFQDRLPELTTVFIEIEGKAVPFIVSSSEKPDNTVVRLLFEGYDSLEKIREFTGCRIFLLSSRSGEKENNDFGGLVGYKITDKGNDPLGSVQEIIENPGQILLGVQSAAGSYVFVPFHEDLIVRIDKRKKIIIMDLPDGLRDLNDPVRE
ncbi:MAG: 16S rRNA processing protein RimM [Bacteroidales bacterium]|jgi:16S rRNA processing protein RimM|nr:16S rRNA processing protein RimM [Bacteroidales bacterium]